MAVDRKKLEKLTVIEQKKYYWVCQACMLRMDEWGSLAGVYLSLLIHLQTHHGATYEEATKEAERLMAAYPRDEWNKKLEA